MDRKSKIAIYIPRGDGGLFDELVLDFYNKHYRYNGNIDERELVRTQDENVKEFCVEKQFFSTLFGIVKQLYGGVYCEEELDYDWRTEFNEEYAAKQAKRPIISNDRVWQALRLELPRKQLNAVNSDDHRYEPDEYYDFDLIMNAVGAAMRGEKSIGYFKAWCGVLIGCLSDYTDCKNEKLRSTYESLALYLADEVSWDSALVYDSPTGRKKSEKFREIVARLKFFDHEIRDIKKGRSTDFTTNGVITYVAFGFGLSGGRTSLYRVCVVDNTKKTINYLYVPKVKYNENVNYTFLSEAEFDDLPSRYYEGYSLDISMTCKHAARRNI